MVSCLQNIHDTICIFEGLDRYFYCFCRCSNKISHTHQKLLYKTVLITYSSKMNRLMTKRIKVKWCCIGNPNNQKKKKRILQELAAKSFLALAKTEPKNLSWCWIIVCKQVLTRSPSETKAVNVFLSLF